MKEYLKRILWLRMIVHKGKTVIYEIYHFFHRYLSFLLLKKNKRIHGDRIKVGFLAQVASSWDKIAPIYEAMLNDNRFEVIMYVVPEEDFSSYEIKPCYEKNYFVDTYRNSKRILDENGNCYDVSKDKLDYLFYQRPYDYRLPRIVRSNRMKKYTRCCYIPYGYTASDEFNGNNLFNIFFDNMSMIFLDSDYMKRLFIKRYPLSYRLGIKKIEFLGYPSLKKYIMWGESEKSEGYITWTPRWSFDKEHGASTFLEYKDKFLKLVTEIEGKYIFRPHPLIKQEIVAKRIMSEKEWECYIDELESSGVVVDIESPIDDILRKTEILITDFSTIIGSFVMMNRPVIYCDTGTTLNEAYKEIAKTLYVAQEWTEVLHYLTSLKNGNDVLCEERKRIVSHSAKTHENSDVAILQFMASRVAL